MRPLPPRDVVFSSQEEKARWLDANASLDAELVYVREVANRFRRAFPHDPESLARSIHRWIRDNIHYRRDVDRFGNRREQFADAETVIRRGFDDCDGKSRAFVALCRAAGLQARIRPVFRKHPEEFVHVQAEVRWPGSERLSEAEPGGWVLAELILKNCALGQSPDTVPRGAHGERVLS